MKSRRRPVEGAKNDGVKGFVKGMGTGFVSGMVKGVTGIKEPWRGDLRGRRVRYLDMAQND